MSRIFQKIALVLLIFYPLQSIAIDTESFSDPVLQKRYVSIISELRCLVCQNQSIEDSNAPLAKDLRRQVREQLEANRSDQEIMNYMVERYGDYVRYRPPLRWSTAGLWIAPLVIAMFGFVMLYLTLRRHLQLGREVNPSQLADGENHESDHSVVDSHSDGSN